MSGAAGPERDAPVAHRSCGSCGLCCKLLAIAELEKPLNKWCSHYRAGAGCTIYEHRPESCRGFYCSWRRRADLGEEWFPGRSRIILYSDETGRRLFVHVDPGFPGAWRAEPYFSQIKRWSLQVKDGRQVLVRIGERMIAVLPTREIDLGVIRSGDVIRTYPVETPNGVEYLAEKIGAAKAEPGG